MAIAINDIDVHVNHLIRTYSDADAEVFSSELLSAMNSSGLIDMLDVNKPLASSTLKDVLHVCQHIGKTDASLAWIVGVSNSAWVMRNCFHSLELNQASIAKNKILAMVLGRPGILKKSDTSSGYLLNGEWRYASGVKYASYFFCLAAVDGSNGQDVRAVAVPAEKLKVIANWNATGLRGTQSVTIRAVDIEILENHIEDYASILSGTNATHGYSRLFTGVLMNCLLGSMLGATEAALHFVAHAVNKGPVAGSTYTLMSDSGAIRAEMGRLHSTLDLYKHAADHNAEVIDKAANHTGHVLSIQDRVENRARATLIMRGCVDIVQDLLWIYGSSGLDKGSFLEKVWRDVNVGARHGGFSKLVPEEAVGLAIIGHDPKNLTRMF
jgi:3-hydroxy-9,10-secoandrosta-1,3,5(10)-triene-9,17-dione monooxygenase